MQTSVEPKEETLQFLPEVDFQLKNYVDKAILQTLIDAKEQDEPLKIIKIPLFKGDRTEKIVDRIAVKESIIMKFM